MVRDETQAPDASTLDQAIRLEDFPPYRLSYSSNLVSDVIATAYQEEFDLNIPQWRLINLIATTGTSTQQALRAKARMPKVTVSRAAAALLDRGLIASTPNLHDKRAQDLSLTPAGSALYAKVVPRAIELERRIFGALDRQQLRILLDTLSIIDTAALTYLNEVRIAVRLATD